MKVPVRKKDLQAPVSTASVDEIINRLADGTARHAEEETPERAEIASKAKDAALTQNLLLAVSDYSREVASVRSENRQLMARVVVLQKANEALRHDNEVLRRELSRANARVVIWPF